jgi:homoserine acetyltransferase
LCLFAYSPIILINHALTGNSQVIGESGGMISGVDKTIDTRKYTIVSFDVPGNGSATIENYRDFIAEILLEFIEGLRVLKIDTLFALIGGSVGGELLGKFWL